MKFSTLLTDNKFIKSCLLTLTAISALTATNVAKADHRYQPAATVFKHCGYQGYRVSLNPGYYNLYDLRRMGVKNDDLSSIQVKRGYVVTLYEHANFQGRSLRLTYSDSCFVNNGFNDIVSSIKVERIGRRHIGGGFHHRPAPIVFQHCNFRGYGVKLTPGWYNLGQLNRLGVRNDDLSSIRVPRGYVVTLYEHANFRGRAIRLTHSDSCFVNNGFNDIVSSIKVERHRFWRR